MNPSATCFSPRYYPPPFLPAWIYLMRRQDFSFELPANLIAQYPLVNRSASRLMCLDGATGALAHYHFHEITKLLQPGDLLVFNDTRVIPARLFAHKATGGKVELLVERMLDEQRFLAHIKASKAPTPGCELLVSRPWQLQVVARHDALFEVALTGTTVLDMLQQLGHMPLPPYIRRVDEQADVTRYQTVYAKHDGAVAAPTAGLHFDTELLASLKQQGIEMVYVTLHVGAGTFQPMRVDEITAHVMHKEIMTVSSAVCEQVNAAKQAGRRVIAVGTTAVRCLESAAQTGVLQPYNGDTAIFIYPGYRFQMVDALITNFHLPESTLLMLVSAFAGMDHVKHAYQTAITEQYRFFSYGDAMFITPQSEAIFAKKG